MKKLVVLFVAVTFLATFTLIGCNQPAAPPASEKGARSGWSTGSTCACTGEGSTGSTGSGWSTCTCTSKIVDGITGYILAKRIYP